MLDGAEAIRTFTEKLTFEEFCKDRKTVDAVVRNLEVIGEAARHIPPSIREQYPRVSWFEIVGMRSILIHEYFDVDFEIVWTTVREDLPSLIARLKEIPDVEDPDRVRMGWNDGDRLMRKRSVVKKPRLGRRDLGAGILTDEGRKAALG
jgi:uncharacterized protein with HEPN domain